MRCDAGFTLIQVMMTVTLMGIIGSMAAPLTGAILSEADITKTEGVLNQAIGKAKSIALRNEAGALSDVTAAAICISDTKVLTVEKGASGTPPKCDHTDGSVVWSAQIGTKSNVQSDIAGTYTDVSCMCFNNKALLAGNACGSTCITATIFKIGGDDPVNIF